MKTYVIHHSADFDGIFCREIAKKFLPDAELIGWDFADKPIQVPDGKLYILDLPCDAPFGFKYKPEDVNRPGPQHPDGLIWIDHHKSAIETHPKSIPGYRIDGVAACRLTWQYFSKWSKNAIEISKTILPTKQDFADRKVSEPLAVRLAGEYDIWDKRDSDAELFQHGLRSENLSPEIWDALLDATNPMSSTVVRLLNQGRALQYARTKENASVIKEIGFTLQWEGLTFLACNAARYNSLLFTEGLTPEHDACFGFKWTGKEWSVSLYHAPGKEQHDLSKIAVKYGGGGHRGACGFRLQDLPDSLLGKDTHH